jgi:hypothetical protein
VERTVCDVAAIPLAQRVEDLPTKRTFFHSYLMCNLVNNKYLAAWVLPLVQEGALSPVVAGLDNVSQRLLGEKN